MQSPECRTDNAQPTKKDEPTSSYRKIVELAVPVGLETVFQTSLGLADQVIVGSYLVGLPAAVLLGIFAGFNVWGVFGARAIEEIIKATAFLLRFRRPAWYQKSVNELSTAPK